MKRSRNEETGSDMMPVAGSIGARRADEPLTGSTPGGMHLGRRNFVTGLLAAPFLMKASLAAAASEFRGARVDSADPLCYASVDELITLFKAGKSSPVDLLKAQIKRIEALNPKVNCITYTHFDQALKEARQSEERYRRGTARPLEGITVAPPKRSWPRSGRDSTIPRNIRTFPDGASPWIGAPASPRSFRRSGTRC